jgi:hypothetical protein
MNRKNNIINVKDYYYYNYLSHLIKREFYLSILKRIAFQIDRSIKILSMFQISKSQV